MNLKKGFINLGKAHKATAVFKSGIVNVFYHNGSGISVKKVNLAEKTVTGGASTDSYYDWYAETPKKTVAIKGGEIICY